MSDRELIVRALDRLAAGDWEGAHDLAQRLSSAEAAWLHAHLHRVEGDPANAAYWYRRAGRPIESGDLEAERRALLEALR
ncbi:hypothetical protein [Aurantimonas sp. Leaf443]|uniref:hypothetical protein n=1 Tax=Aurantimonas sp. Leaf443 TaxID=1736378 RepID=UPI0006FA61A2|nr:hypothetical protein [Aurantimonas sp. Leaf443]KQT83416.1 hypothetical protein ASG48_12705 [Aurantimonas sp. Leaf443]